MLLYTPPANVAVAHIAYGDRTDHDRPCPVSQLPGPGARARAASSPPICPSQTSCRGLLLPTPSVKPNGWQNCKARLAGPPAQFWGRRGSGNKRPRRWARQVRIEKSREGSGRTAGARFWRGVQRRIAACVRHAHGDVKCAARGSDSGHALRGMPQARPTSDAQQPSCRRCARWH